uniref:Invertebrate defensins family profile domain-containing protein n=1 Tax=Stomoxys calcitrans TaxID=35570 RepID=A0A2Y9D4K7_STOCA
MKLYIIVSAFFLLAVCWSLPSTVQDGKLLVRGQSGGLKLSSRHKRSTCDLVSIPGFENMACKSHCLMRGYRKGGNCKQNRCYCIGHKY